MSNNYKTPEVEVFNLELENAILQASGSGEDMIPLEFGE